MDIGCVTIVILAQTKTNAEANAKIKKTERRYKNENI